MKRDTKIVAAVIAAIPVVILGAATLCTAAIAAGASMQWRLLFRILCHGVPIRCLELFGVPMPICARCTGIYLGLLAGVIAFLLLPSLEEASLRILLFIAAVPIGIDGMTQMIGLRESTNPIRIATGFVVAVAFAMWALTAMEKPDRSEVTAS